MNENRKAVVAMLGNWAGWQNLAHDEFGMDGAAQKMNKCSFQNKYLLYSELNPLFSTINIYPYIYY